MPPSRLFPLILTLLLSLSAAAQTQFTLVELNAENLFDCHHDEGFDDVSFLPDSPRRWTPGRLQRKLNLLGRTLAIIGGGRSMPDLVALCEVENDTVMQKLITTSTLWSWHYKYFMTHSQDARGIDVALMYRPESFRPIAHRSIRPSFHGLPAKRTRDLLHVTGILQTGDTLDVFVVHSPSRIDRHQQGRPYRLQLMQQLRAIVDSTMQRRVRPGVVITGDFNASADDESVVCGLRAEQPKAGATAYEEKKLYCLPALTEERHPEVGGNYFYDGTWETIDHVCVNGLLLTAPNGLHTQTDRCLIADKKFLLGYKKGQLIPRRTYNGMRWEGGLSDHLPLVVRFDYSW